MSNVTRLLSRLQNGEPQAAAELLPMVYDELRQMAVAKMARANIPARPFNPPPGSLFPLLSPVRNGMVMATARNFVRFFPRMAHIRMK